MKHFFILFFLLIFCVHFSTAQINLVPGWDKIGKAQKLSEKVNSESYDGGPFISPDGKTLYIYRVAHPDNVGIELRPGEDEDIWYSTLDKNKNWSLMANPKRPLNNEFNNGVCGFSPDGNTLYLYDFYNAQGIVTGVAVSYRTSEGWSEPMHLPIKNYDTQPGLVFMYLTLDRKTLLLSMKSDRSFGGSDLFISFLEPTGSFSSPKNLGLKLNTKGEEISPFLAADNRTLYFASTGHPGYGNYDIFVTKRLDDTWTNWTKPQNLGSNINTPKWDSEWSISTVDDIAYYISGATIYKDDADIYKVVIPDSAKPLPTLVLKGKVFDSKTKKPLEVEIAYHDLKTNEQLGIIHSSSMDGSYKILLPYGKSYTLYATRKGYFPITENVYNEKPLTTTELKKDLFVAPVEIGTKVTLKNVLFVMAKADLKPEAFPELDRLLLLLKTYPKMKIELSGHTDNVGDKSKLQTLSEERVQTVKTYLINKGIDPNRLSGKGYGCTKPIASNGNEKSRMLNRRVEFMITQSE